MYRSCIRRHTDVGKAKEGTSEIATAGSGSGIVRILLGQRLGIDGFLFGGLDVAGKTIYLDLPVVHACTGINLLAGGGPERAASREEPSFSLLRELPFTFSSL